MIRRGLRALAVLVFLAACSSSPGPAPEGSSPSATPRSTPSPNTPAPVIAAAGDIACSPDTRAFNGGQGRPGECRQAATAGLLAGKGLAAVLLLGDLQYEEGRLGAFRRSFDASWGQYRDLLRPAPGNHEYETPQAAGYFAYFGKAAGDPARGYYSFDVGSWHVVALNSNCWAVGGCQAGSPQERWLRADLAANPAACTLAYWHHSRFSSGKHGSDDDYEPFWRALYDAGADVVLTAHDHHYERFAPQDPAGARDPARGLRAFVVGTGGRSSYPAPRPLLNSEAKRSGVFGVLFLTLREDGYDFQFEAEPVSTSPTGEPAAATEGRALEIPLAGPAGEPVDLLRTLVSHGVASLPPMQVDEKACTIEVTLQLGVAGARTLRIERGTHAGLARVTARGPALRAAERAAATRVVRRMLCLDDDLSAFYALAAGDPDLVWTAAGAGRMLRGPTVFEDVVKTVCTTNCTWSATTRMVGAIVGELGQEAPGGARAFPTPEAMASAGEAFYRDVARAGYRGRYLMALAEAVAGGDVDLEALLPAGGLPDDEVARRLAALPGVGPYAVAHIMMLLGRHSRLVLDSWTRPTYARLAGKQAVADRTIERRFRRYGPHAGLAFWLVLTRDWVDEG